VRTAAIVTLVLGALVTGYVSSRSSTDDAAAPTAAGRGASLALAAFTEAQCERADDVLWIAWRGEIPEGEWSPAFAEHATKMAAAYEATGGLTPPAGAEDPYEDAVVRYIQHFDAEYVEWLEDRRLR
jgi:hypothetical protein